MFSQIKFENFPLKSTLIKTFCFHKKYLSSSINNPNQNTIYKTRSSSNILSAEKVQADKMYLISMKHDLLVLICSITNADSNAVDTI